MKTIIAGSRDITNFEVIIEAVRASEFRITEVVSGTARGVDRLGERWAELKRIPIRRFPADWDTYGRGAGHMRNREMSEYAEALIAVWDGASRGTESMIEYAREQLIPVYVHMYKECDRVEVTLTP